ncbi:MAG: hypothetical protein ACJ0F4_01580 [Gammaproteobacteria bacterium]
MNRTLVKFTILSLILSGCASNNYVEIIDESSEGLLSYIDFSNIDTKKEGFNPNILEQDKTECAISASTADIDGNDLANIGAASVGAAAGAASASTAAASAAAGPIALLSVGIVYGAQKLSSRKRAAPIKAMLLTSCLNERGYEVGIKQR